jgi:septal ring factor EnvC (AmiA/AmiB activator)
MASESTGDGSVTVSLPSELDEWLSARAQTLGVDRDVVLLQLLSSYRAASELDDENVPVAGPQAIEQAVTDRLSETSDAVEQRVGERVDAVEQRHEEDIEDVRSRVVQLKRELDGKAPADHDHDQFGTIDDLQAELSDLQSTVAEMDSELDSTVAEHDVVLDEMDEQLLNLQERLKTVAWVVSDLRDAFESRGGLEAVEHIKRAAAKADIDRANCESCGQGVDIALLTDPECPHCQATVTNVEAADSWFSSPRLLAASQLESGEEQ